MPSGSFTKLNRQKQLKLKLSEDPFLTDEELACLFNVSVPTIRLDRIELGIPDLRGRIKEVAETNYNKLKSIKGTEIVGELLDLELGKGGISVFEPTKDMVFEKSHVVKGQYIYAQAESLAIAVIDADVALIGVANIKYRQPVKLGDKLIAKAEVIRQRGNKYFVWVKIKVQRQEVFRGKFILVSLDTGEGDGAEDENRN
ncbi:transcription factor FapR [Calorimonas adulescens]|uniref:Transcription factor FapR n=1 Tax=Calorimonas adulescens TaxID=2606906 RepID=A0A5D8QFC6_9THEO|nr:transcription factor FapR [Calorimonas adulescens]TZE83390.1 transcription factor FapR [Calorimonas adulescens]